MRRFGTLLCVAGTLAAVAHGCARGNATTTGGGGGAAGGGAGGATTGGTGGAAGAAGSAGSGGSSTGGMGGELFELDAGTDAMLDPDAACATAVETATATLRPVDIIWMIDNSSSMQAAIAEVTAGMNDFAALIAAESIDYKVILLSLRNKTSPVQIAGGTRYPICIPAPLAGDDNCGNGARFFQSSIDIRSTQPLEQFLGTLGQTAGYALGEAKGGEPWAQELRPQATKTIVVVSDDNARLSATDFETFPGGTNPFNSLKLPPGVLDPSWNGLFQGYVFDGIYGWGSDIDPGVKCTFPDGSTPASAGPTYTTLVNKTGGVRAKLCDGAAAWTTFFDQVAEAVVETTKLSCELAIPAPSNGSQLDPSLVNVALVDGATTTTLPKVAGAAACGPGGGWYYDDDVLPTKVFLCAASCDAANAIVGPGKAGTIQVLFGCQTITN